VYSASKAAIRSFARCWTQIVADQLHGGGELDWRRKV
jgi:hypothetical protein